MITIISGTNRTGSRTELVARHITQEINSKTKEEINFVKLADLPAEMYSHDMYSPDKQHPLLSEVQDSFIIPASKWIIVSPEYNGSYSASLKVFIDALSVRRYAETFRGKKVGLIGTSAGRAGNLRGMEHITGFANYLGMHVYPDKLPISSIEQQLVDGDLNENTQQALGKWMDGFVRF